MSAAAHDFKTPLALIYGLASELAHDNDPDFVASSAQDIAAASDRLIRMIDTVSLAHHVSQTEFELELEPVDVVAAVNEAAYELSPLAEKFEHNLSVRISRRVPTVMGHQTSVRRIIHSLLDAAIRSAKGAESIELGVKRVGEQVSISITDATSGIKPREWTRIIAQPGSTKQPSPALGNASGISFYAVKQLATAMNGNFSTHTTNKGKGAVFTLKLQQVAQLRLF